MLRKRDIDVGSELLLDKKYLGKKFWKLWVLSLGFDTVKVKRKGGWGGRGGG